jgi:hypothetical protein
MLCSEERKEDEQTGLMTLLQGSLLSVYWSTLKNTCKPVNILIGQGNEAEDFLVD